MCRQLDESVNWESQYLRGIAVTELDNTTLGIPYRWRKGVVEPKAAPKILPLGVHACTISPLGSGQDL